MNRLIASALVLAIAATGACTATQAGAPSAAAPAQTRASFDTRADPAFGDATPALRAYLAAVTPPPAGAQHFCVIGHDYGDGGKAAQVHWREGNRLILWEGASDPAYAADAIRQSRRNLDLTKDVVATEADINGSTYLVTRAWVDGVLADCAARGAQYTITR